MSWRSRNLYALSSRPRMLRPSSTKPPDEKMDNPQICAYGLKAQDYMLTAVNYTSAANAKMLFDMNRKRHRVAEGAALPMMSRARAQPPSRQRPKMPSSSSCSRETRLSSSRPRPRRASRCRCRGLSFPNLVLRVFFLRVPRTRQLEVRFDQWEYRI